jgi:hypothetical protein
LVYPFTICPENTVSGAQADLWALGSKRDTDGEAARPREREDVRLDVQPYDVTRGRFPEGRRCCATLVFLLGLTLYLESYGMRPSGSQSLTTINSYCGTWCIALAAFPYRGSAIRSADGTTTSKHLRDEITIGAISFVMMHSK